jgi:predicted Rossmann fold flavoprotein
LLFSFQEKTIVAKPDYIVYALGGASWPVTGSDGDWLNLFSKRRITTIPFESSNCAVCCNWNNSFLKIADGTFLKNIVLKFNGIEKAGELVITKSGMEGGVVYALNYAIREELKNKENAVLHIDLKPVFSVEQIENTLANKKNKSITHQLKSVLKLSETAIALLQFTLSKHEFSIPKILAFSIKNLPIKIHYLASIEDSISTVGGISLDEISVAFELKKIKNNFVIGEMLNWDAPTGGYLLQGCFSMANYIAHYLNTKKT